MDRLFLFLTLNYFFSSFSSAQLVFYQNENYQGNATSILTGFYPLIELAFTPKSLQIPANGRITLYRSSNFTGESITLYENVTSLFDYNVSSAIFQYNFNDCFCGSNGICQQNGTCLCKEGFAGSNCGECSTGYFGRNCKACNCTSMLNSNCEDGLDGTGSCSCKPGWTGALCNQCAVNYFGPNCTKCSCGFGYCNATGQCICGPGRLHGWNGQPCSRCGDRFFADSSNNCQACFPGCQFCSPPNGTCQLCGPGYSIDPNDRRKCIKTACPVGFYMNASAICTQCRSYCYDCAELNRCTNCDSARVYVVQDDYCVTYNAFTGVCAFDRQTFLTNRVYDPNKLTCQFCPVNCSQCGVISSLIGSWKMGMDIMPYYGCTSCPPNRVLEGFKCLEQCSKGKYASNGRCLDCNSICETCNGPLDSNCLTCRNQSLALVNGSCRSLQTCPPGTFANLNSTKCQACSSNCETCFGPESDQCLTCSNTWQLLLNGSCVEACQLGYFADVNSKTCRKCHSECSSCRGPNSTDCITYRYCNAGYFWNNGICSPCSIGEFNDITSTETTCTKCPINTIATSEIGSTSFENACLCNAGYFFEQSNNTCIPCPINQFKTFPGNNATCQYCSIYSETVATASTVCLCSRGYYRDEQGNCAPCLFGTFKNETSNAPNCYSCPLFSTTNNESAISINDCQCIQGYYFAPTNNSCTSCPRNSLKSEVSNSDTCQACPIYSVTRNTSETSISDCQCIQGYYFSAINNTCTACPLNTFKTEIDNALSCQACHIYSVTRNTSATSISDCQCIQGYYFSDTNNTCAACPLNTFKTENDNALSCQACPIYSATRNTSATSISDCQCVQGYYFSTTNNSCIACPFDTFKSEVGNSVTCQTCPLYSVTNFTSTISTSDCLCLQGYYYSSTNKSCVTCAFDTFKSDVGNALSCQACPIYSVTRNTTATSISDCQCIQGYNYSTTNNSCTACPLNTFKSDVGNALSCQACPLYSVTNYTSAISISDCQCIQGYFFSATNNSCTACPLNSFKSNIGNALSCQACPLYSATTNNKSATSISDCQCVQGYYYSTTNKSCLACPFNTFKTEVGSALSCQACPSYSVTQNITGAKSMSDCQCMHGYFYSDMNNACTQCPFDSFKSEVGNSKSCQSCPPHSTTRNISASVSINDCKCIQGFYFSAVNSTCTACPLNSFKPQIVNSESCESCPLYSTTRDKLAATSIRDCQCIQGYFYSTTNATCTACPLNTYKAEVGNSASCQTCPPHTVVTNNICECDAGYYYNATDSSCTACPNNTFKSSTGNSSICQLCPNNTSTMNITAATDVSTCKPIEQPPPSTNYTFECKAGFYYNATNGFCNECPVNTWKSNIGNNSICQPCPQNTTTLNLTAATNISFCQPFTNNTNTTLPPAELQTSIPASFWETYWPLAVVVAGLFVIATVSTIVTVIHTRAVAKREKQTNAKLQLWEASIADKKVATLSKSGQLDALQLQIEPRGPKKIKRKDYFETDFQKGSKSGKDLLKFSSESSFQLSEFDDTPPPYTRYS